MECMKTNRAWWSVGRRLRLCVFVKSASGSKSLQFLPKSFAHNFRSFCCCFASIRLKNITIKSLGQLAPKLPKVTNQRMMTYFCTQTIHTSFSVILLLFPINMVKKCLKQKYRTLNMKTCQKRKSTQITTFFAQIFHK